MNYDASNWKNLQSIYTSIYADILENKNLQKHLNDVEHAIIDLDRIIVNELKDDKPTPALEEMKNDFYFLKFQILERL